MLAKVSSARRAGAHADSNAAEDDVPSSAELVELAAETRARRVNVVSRRSRLAANAASNASEGSRSRSSERSRSSPRRARRARFEYAAHATRAPPNAARRDAASAAAASASETVLFSFDGGCGGGASAAFRATRRRSSVSSSARPTARAAVSTYTERGVSPSVAVARSPKSIFQKGRDAATRARVSSAAATFAIRLAKTPDADVDDASERVVSSSARAQCSSNVPRSPPAVSNRSEGKGGVLERSTRASSQ